MRIELCTPRKFSSHSLLSFSLVKLLRVLLFIRFLDLFDLLQVIIKFYKSLVMVVQHLGDERF
jgi:hypothetical protein